MKLNCSLDELERELETILRVVRDRHRTTEDNFDYVFKLRLGILRDMIDPVKPIPAKAGIKCQK